METSNIAKTMQYPNKRTQQKPNTNIEKSSLQALE